ncbi:MAG: TetR/AcrR family transcriptional regulator [Thermoguttaceae bacterium]
MPKLTAIRKQALDGMMKQALYEATIAVLSTHGVDGLTMDRVAAEAGIAKGSLYRYFRSKRDLLEFVYAKLVDPVFENMEEVAAKQQPAIEKLSEQLHMLLEHAAQHAQVHKLLFEDEAVDAILQSTKRRGSEVACQRLAKMFEQGIAEGVFRPSDPLMLATLYLGLIKNVLERLPKLEEREQRENLHRLILGTLFNGIATEKVDL